MSIFDDAVKLARNIERNNPAPRQQLPQQEPRVPIANLPDPVFFPNVSAVRAGARKSDVLPEKAVIFISGGNFYGNASILNVSGGNLGIGTTSPASTLHINGSTSSAIRIQRAGTASYGEINYSTAVMKVGTVSSDHFGFITNNAERMRILETGEVGIGTESPGTKLHISGGAVTISNTTAPSTPAGAGAIFVSGGACWFIGSSGTQTQLGAA